MPAPTKSTITPPTIRVPTGGLESAFSERVCCAEEPWTFANVSASSAPESASAAAPVSSESGSVDSAACASSAGSSGVAAEPSFASGSGAAESLGLGDVVLVDDDPGLELDAPEDEGL